MPAENKINLDEKTQQQIQEIQILEQNLQNLLLQKQAFQVELNETENALSEISKSKDDIFKLISNIMIKTNKEQTQKELKQKQELLSLRLGSIEKQETQLSEQVEKLRKEIMKGIK